MMYIETGEVYQLNSHHVLLRKSVEKIRLGKEYEEGGQDESERGEGEV